MRLKTSMRVVGGKAKSQRLQGTIAKGARPTTERVRAAIFNILDPESYQGKKVLDLYAGSGSLGIEALSRGAARADFVEWDRRQCEVIRSNLANTGFRGVNLTIPHKEAGLKVCDEVDDLARARVCGITPRRRT